MTSTAIKKTRSYLPSGQMGRRLSEAQNLQNEIQRLTKKLELHRKAILGHMITQNLDKIEFANLVVCRKIRHNWTYTSATENLAQQLRQAQKWEQQDGVAVDNPTIYVSLTTTPGV